VAICGVRSDFPLILATNRDEFYARASTGPERLLEAPLTVGGRDLAAGGTWMGVTREGLFVGVTNQRTLELPDRARRSRGQLVLELLAAGSAAEVTRRVEALDPRVYNACNLMWGDAGGLHVGYLRGVRGEDRAPEIERVPPGIHVLPNDRLDSPSFVKVQRARELLDPVVDAPFPELERALEGVLADRARPSLEEIPDPPPASVLGREILRELAALCVRTEVYGTRSSTVVALAEGCVRLFRYADGPPDGTPFVDVMPLYDGDPPRA
jgi:uncharacterized protein with NRDE domain